MDLLHVAARVAAGDEDDFSKLFPPPKELPADVDVERFDNLAGLRGARQKARPRLGRVLRELLRRGAVLGPGRVPEGSRMSFSPRA